MKLQLIKSYNFFKMLSISKIEYCYYIKKKLIISLGSKSIVQSLNIDSSKRNDYSFTPYIRFLREPEWDWSNGALEIQWEPWNRVKWGKNKQSWDNRLTSFCMRGTTNSRFLLSIPINKCFVGSYRILLPVICLAVNSHRQIDKLIT